MRAKLLAGVFALMLCTLILSAGVFLFPVTAFAASDTTPPTIDAWLNGDTLHIEAGDDDSGVEAVYMDSRRYNYFVDGVVQVNAKEHHGGNETISVYAIDFAGNKSRVIEIKNPFYKATAAPAPSSTPQGTTPRPDPTPPSSSSQTSRPASTPPATSTPEPSGSSQPESTSSAVPDSSGANPFTPDGQAEVLDNATDDDGKEFFTITTPEGNIFFLVIDRQRNSDNVYLLNAVTEYDLAQLAEDGGVTQSAVPDPEPAPAEPPPSTSEPEPTPDPAPEEKPASGMNTGTVIFLLVAALAAGGAGYYIKIYKPRQQAPDAEEDYGEYGDDDEEMEYDDPEDAGDDYEGYADVPEYEYPDGDADFDFGDEGDSRPGEEE